MEIKYLIGILMVVVFLSGCSQVQTSEKSDSKNNLFYDSAAEVSSSTDSNVGEEYDVEIIGVWFEPSEIVINKGDTVTWQNMDDDKEYLLNSDGFNSPVIRGQQVFSYKFTETGVYEYQDVKHANLEGKIIVN